jgi:hypothetical protein
MWKRDEVYFEFPDANINGNIIIAAIDDQG